MGHKANPEQVCAEDALALHVYKFGYTPQPRLDRDQFQRGSVSMGWQWVPK
jgi:hypothetical protein